MPEIYLKNRKKRVAPRITAVLLIILIIILGRATWNVFQKNTETGENLKEISQDFEELQKKQEDLENEIKRLSTERGIDEEIREKFRVVKEGEEMIVLVELPRAEGDLDISEEKTLWQKFLDLF